MADTVTYRLSSIDQSFIRAYVRYSLCFPCDDDEAVRQQVVANLIVSVKRAISNTPILAGKVHAVDDDHKVALQDSVHQDSINSTKQAGRVEARVTLAQVNDFKPTIKVLSFEEFPDTYEELNDEKMPANAFINDELTPLPDSPGSEDEGAPAFAVQANFIAGGVIVCLYLHHSVADLKGLSRVIKAMSNVGWKRPSNEDIRQTLEKVVLDESHTGKWPSKNHTQETLKQDAFDQSSMRDGLSGTRGMQANLEEHPEYQVAIRKPLAPSKGTSRVLALSLEMICGIKDMLNERFQYMYDRPEIKFTTFDTLAAVLWKAIIRARHQVHLPAASEINSRIFVPVDMAKRLERALDQEKPGEFYGNSYLFGTAEMPLSYLKLPFDISSMVMAANAIRDSIRGMTEAKARSAIAVINETEDVKTLNHPNIDFSTDVFITNWDNLPIGDEATLGLELGRPQWTRKVSRNQSAYGCVLLPQKQGEGAPEGVWEVTVNMAHEEMERLLADEGLAPFIRHAA